MRLIVLIAYALLSAFVYLPGQAMAQGLQNTYHRQGQSLDGRWHYIIDPYEVGYYDYRHRPFDQQAWQSPSAFYMNHQPKDKTELLEYDFAKSPTLQVPGDWNSQRPELLYYENTVWYQRLFDDALAGQGGTKILQFGAVNYHAIVYLNGKRLGEHFGGFTPFQFNVTGLLKPSGNNVVVKVDAVRRPEEVPTVNTDWWNYGGITRSVTLYTLPATHVADYSLQLSPGKPQRAEGYVQLAGPNAAAQTVALSMPGLGIQQRLQTNAQGRATFSLKLPQYTPWSPQNPVTHALQLATTTDTLHDRVGLRTISTKGADILLNGKPIFLRGISLHEENPMRGGRAHSRADAELLLGWAKALGCNYVRLAHYPHNEHMVRVAEEMGLMVWEEIPVYWTIQWENPATYARAAQQLTEMIGRDKNRANVIIWSMANETPVSPARNAFLKQLVDSARVLDPTRLISAAMEVHTNPESPNQKSITDPFAEYVDILSFNQYIGWYDGLPDKLASIRWQITQNKPVVISEFGAGAKLGYHADAQTRWTEEYQADLYAKTLAMLQTIPQWRGVSPWILVDFRSPRRPLAHIQEGWNRKGLIAEDGQRKQAFYTLQSYYRKLERK